MPGPFFLFPNYFFSAPLLRSLLPWISSFPGLPSCPGVCFFPWLPPSPSSLLPLAPFFPWGLLLSLGSPPVPGSLLPLGSPPSPGELLLSLAPFFPGVPSFPWGLLLFRGPLLPLGLLLPLAPFCLSGPSLSSCVLPIFLVQNAQGLILDGGPCAVFVPCCRFVHKVPYPKAALVH